MRRGISVSEAIKRRQQRTFTIYGKPYESIKVAANEYNVPFSFLMKRRRAGMPLEEAIDGWHQKEPRLKDKSEAKRFGDWKGYVAYEKKVKEWDDQFNSVAAPSMLSCIPSKIDSRIPGTDKRCKVSLIAFQSSSAKRTALPRLPVITTGSWLTDVSSINLYRLALASVTFSIVIKNPL